MAVATANKRRRVGGGGSSGRKAHLPSGGGAENAGPEIDGPMCGA